MMKVVPAGLELTTVSIVSDGEIVTVVAKAVALPKMIRNALMCEKSAGGIFMMLLLRGEKRVWESL
jgi:hypothetical protein